MSYTTRCFRYFVTRLLRTNTPKYFVKVFQNELKFITPAPCMIGFSLYTLLGFESKVSAEDELIKTVKHCIIFIQNNELTKAEQLLHVALRQAQQIHHELGITYIYDVMANLALEREQLDKAKKLFVTVSQRLMSDGATDKDLRIVHISIKLARISHLQGDHKVAQLGYEWCLKQLNQLKLENPDNAVLSHLIALAKDWYGRLFLDSNQLEHGFKLMSEALDLMKLQPTFDQEHVIQQMNDLGTVSDYMGKVDDSIDYYKKAIEKGKQLPEYGELGAIYVNLGRAYIKKNLHDMARKNCGLGWKLGYKNKNDDVTKEAELCIKEIKEFS